MQGNSCPQSIKSGISYFNDLHQNIPFDVLIVARGGGSTEDLIGYSSKDAVKAIYETPIIVISAVGHETDTMLSDLAADFRAPTPSIAGETVSKTQKKNMEMIKDINNKITMFKNILNDKIDSMESKILYYKKILESYHPERFINDKINHLLQIQKIAHDKILYKCNSYIQSIENAKNKLEKHNVNKMMSNGFVLIVDDDNNIINNIDQLKQNIHDKQKLKILLNDGEVELNKKLFKHGHKKHKSKH